ncbi:MAG TPA: CHASE4 domain-containing protein [Kiritimatiellia bacterium]|nr:CHASE4 domain-containing protein [Kiritimatiellia bacterium]HRZ10914.1 CHASE4 domain-containing protein [Kiritimatiellia bacterium]HSA18813.1 CHASE4 domain-containing protein [Kiritimatiellia bacterium]
MKLGSRVLLALGPSLAVLFIVLYAVGTHGLRAGFADLEQRFALQNVQQVQWAVEAEGRHLDRSVADWAFWDDTYAFVEDRNEAFIESNLTLDTFQSLGIRLLIIVDPSGAVVWGGIRDPESSAVRPLPDDAARWLAPGAPLARGEEGDWSLAGLMSLAGEPLVVAARPILTSQREGPPRGTVVMGRALDAAWFGELAAILHLQVNVYPARALPSHVTESGAWPALLRGAPAAILPLDENTMRAYALLRDLEKQPAAVIEIRRPRMIYAVGLRIARFGRLMLGLVALVFISAIVVLLRRLVSRPLANLRRDIDEVSASPGFTRRVPRRGPSELAGVADHINRLLDLVAESHRFLDSIIENIPNMIFIKDARELRFVRFNRAGEDLLGTTREELIGRSDRDIFPKEQADFFIAKDREVLEGRKPLDIPEERLQTRRKGARILHTRKVPVLNERGEPEYMLGISEDITEWKRVDEQRRATEAEMQRLLEAARKSRKALLSVVEDQKRTQASLTALSFRQEALLSAIPDIVMEVDARQVYTWANPAGLAFFGADVVGRSASSYFAGEQSTEDLVKPVFEGSREVVYVESWQRRQDGQKRLLAWWCRGLKNDRGEVIGAISTARDITEQSVLEEQVRQIQKIEAIGRLAGGVSHDFNNMLGVIIGHAEMAMESIEPGQPLLENLQEILTAARRSADLTRQLLAFARKQTITPRVLDVNETVAGMLKMLRRLIGEDIELVWEPGPDVWPVKMDPAQMDQVLANLSVNARDAMKGAGMLTIRTENVVVEESDVRHHPGSYPGEFVMLTVRDTGTGMDKATMEHIFEPFFTTKEAGKGTGLGLSTVFGIVKQNRGWIEVASRPGQGATFRISLPRERSAAEEEAVSAEGSAGGTETILLVEDELPILKLGEKILKKAGYTVLAARAPGEAMALAAGHPGRIHLLITDVVMPTMNGKDLRDKLAETRPDMKALYISGYTADVIGQHGVLDEGIQFLQKPFTGRTLNAKVREVLDRKKA